LDGAAPGNGDRGANFQAGNSCSARLVDGKHEDFIAMPQQGQVLSVNLADAGKGERPKARLKMAMR
jgi:hypothetical protein